MLKPKILISVGWYLPGYKGGGPLRTLANMVERLGSEFEFKIITADRDSGDTKPYPEIKIDDWSRVGQAEVFYTSSNRRSLRGFKNLLCSIDYNVLYLNSFFSPHFTIKLLLLRILRLIPDSSLVIAPRGEFSPSALGHKRLKKLAYIAVSKTLGFYRGIIWQASSKHEESDIRRWFGNDVRVIIAPDLPPLPFTTRDIPLKREKIKNCLKIVFLSRISLMKNLRGALEMLNGLKGQIQFDIYGPVEDKAYWTECKKTISNMSENIEVQYCSGIPHAHVTDVMGAHDLFFLPTLGENFGHVILEALCAGCPVLISDRTPWRGLEGKGIGWDIPLDRPELFRETIQTCIDMDSVEHRKWSERAREYGLQVTKDEKTVEKNRLLFQCAIDTING